jgi:glycosyltransferase involved in cell wall biosynthesis
VTIAYWTTACLAPQFEAVSKEVFDLAAGFRDSRIFAVSPHLKFKVSRQERTIGFHSRFMPILRAVIPFLERAVSLNHVYAEINPWLYLSALSKRPTVLTIASEKGDPEPELLRRCEVIVTQTEEMRQRLAQLGLPPDRLRLIYPGIDLTRFAPRAPQSSSRRTRVLFATFPRDEAELAGRGVLLLLEIAKRCPEVDFTFLSRPWSSGNTARSAVERRIRALGLRNVTIPEGLQNRMAELYGRHDFTVIPYTQADGGKECPRSMIEALASGLPVLISERSPFGGFIAKHECGAVFACDPESFASALESALRAYPKLSLNAANVARARFDLRETLRRYAVVYDELARYGRQTS